MPESFSIAREQLMDKRMNWLKAKMSSLSQEEGLSRAASTVKNFSPHKRNTNKSLWTGVGNDKDPSQGLPCARQVVLLYLLIFGYCVYCTLYPRLAQR